MLSTKHGTAGKLRGSSNGPEGSERADDEQAVADISPWLVALGFTPLYALSLFAGFAFFLTPDSVSPFWPSAGVLSAALLLTPYRVWPLLAILAGVCEYAIVGIVPENAALAFVNVLDVVGPVVGATLFRVFVSPRIQISSLKHAVALTGLAFVVAALTALSSTYRFVHLSPSVHYVSAWQAWWFGHALGVIIVTPLLLSWVDNPRIGSFELGRGLELSFVFALLLAAGIWVLGASPEPFASILDFPFVTFPLIIWLALRFDIRTVTLASALIAFFTVWNASQGRGPFTMTVAESVQANILGIQTFLATVSLSSLFLAAGLADRRRATEAKELLQRQAAEAQKLELVARLAGSVAHDFNNDLTIMMSWIDFLKDRTGGNPELERAVAQISRAADRGASITNQLLSFGRAAPGPKQTVDVTSLTKDWETLLQPLFHGPRRLEVTADADTGFVRADPHQLEQALLNLAINARDAMPKGGTLRIHAFPMRDGVGKDERVGILVSDDGEGMSEEVRSRIFEPFFTTKEEGRGTGLGLPSVQRIVKDLGGTMQVESSPGEGTHFQISLPAAQAAPKPPPSPDLAAVPVTETILVVDDDDGVREAVSLTLESGGYTVLPATNGVEALAVMKAHADIVDLVITDLNMPEKGGEALIDDLFKTRPSLPVLVVSGYSSSDDAEELPEQIQFVPKPFSGKLLLSCVREALDNRRPSKLSA